MIRIDEIWLATEPLDMRAGPDTALARVVAVFGAAKPHYDSPFAHLRSHPMSLPVHDALLLLTATPRLAPGQANGPR
uniref:transposase n=1 Tax=Marinobacterium profundum TaxID=1714300 RepID=UPI000829A23B